MTFLAVVVQGLGFFPWMWQALGCPGSAQGAHTTQDAHTLIPACGSAPGWAELQPPHHHGPCLHPAVKKLPGE